MNLNVRSKLIIISVAVLCSAISANTILNSIIFTKEYSTEIQSKMYVIGETLKSQLNRLLFLKIAVDDIFGFEEQCQELIRKYPFISYVMVLDLEGKALFHNDVEKQNQTIDDPEILNLLGGLEMSNRISKVDDQEVQDFFIPVADRDNRLVATIRIGFPIDIIRDKINRMIIITVLITIFFLLIGSVVIFLALNNWIIKPIDKLMSAIDKIKVTGTIIDVRIPISSNDEIGRLSDSFNRMAEELVKDKQKKEAAENELKKYQNNLEELVEERTNQLKSVQQELIDQAHQAGMAQIATDTLHNVGNVLNSVKTTGYVLKEILSSKTIEEFTKANAILKSKMDSLEDFITQDPKAKSLLNYYLALESPFANEKKVLSTNVDRLNDKINTIAEIIMAQQLYASVGGATALHSIEKIINDTLTMMPISTERFKMNIKKDITSLPDIPLQKTKFIHILINLLNNAKDAMAGIPEEHRVLSISAKQEEQAVLLQVSDTGRGIKKSDLNKVFSTHFSKIIGTTM